MVNSIWLLLYTFTSRFYKKSSDSRAFCTNTYKVNRILDQLGTFCIFLTLFNGQFEFLIELFKHG